MDDFSMQISKNDMEKSCTRPTAAKIWKRILVFHILAVDAAVFVLEFLYVFSRELTGVIPSS